MWLKACLNGLRPVGSHPALPVTPDELARKGRRAVKADIHPRALDGLETLEAEAIAVAAKWRIGSG